MSASPVPGRSYEVTCPHCSKPFRAELLEGAAARYNGFKCPHCRLFVPLDRVDDDTDEGLTGGSARRSP